MEFGATGSDGLLTELRPGSPDTHRGPHPPDTGYTPGVSELCRTHIHTHAEGAAEIQRPGAI